MAKKIQYSDYQVNIFNKVLDTNRNLVISASAGSGKSSTLFKIASILRNEDVLFFAFNTHIAKYAADRLKAYAKVKVQTTHSYGLSCIKSAPNKKNGPNFAKSEFNHSKVWNYIEANVKNYKLRGLYFSALTTLRTFGCLSYTAKGIEKFVRENPEILNQIGDSKVFSYSATIASMLKALDDETHHYDFDDMLRFPVIYNLMGYGYLPKVLLVDEAQDLSGIQFRYIEHFIDNDVRIIAVGDSNQSIYSFRGACGEAMDTIKELGNARRMPLSITY